DRLAQLLCVGARCRARQPGARSLRARGGARDDGEGRAEVHGNPQGDRSRSDCRRGGRSLAGCPGENRARQSAPGAGAHGTPRFPRPAAVVSGNGRQLELADATADRGAFIAPTLLYCRQPASAAAIHEVEAFGPVCTVMPYEGLDGAIALARRGAGSLVGSVFTADDAVAARLVLGLAPFHGRVLV